MQTTHFCVRPISSNIFTKCSLLMAAAVVGNDGAQRELDGIRRAEVHDRRQFLKVGGAAALAGAAVGCGAGGGGGGGSANPTPPTAYDITGDVRSTFGNTPMAPYKASLNSTPASVVSTDGKFALDNIPAGEYDLIVENVAAASTLRMKRIRHLSLSGKDANVVQGLYAVPGDYDFDLAHNNQMCLGKGSPYNAPVVPVNPGTSRRFADGVNVTVRICRNYQSPLESGKYAPTSEYAINQAIGAVGRLNAEFFVGLMSQISYELIDKEPETGAGSEGTIIVTFKDGTGAYGGPVDVQSGKILNGKVWMSVGFDPHWDSYAVHEMLHVFGFDHVQDTDSIMFPGTLPQNPMQQDLDSIRWKYRRNVGAVVSADQDRD